MSLQSGQILNNRYRIVSLLGQGGFGAVYRAWDLNLQRPCAFKENLDTSPESQRQFFREATLLSNLTHPNLPRVTDHFSLPGQGQYLVMDYVEGEDLETKLAQAGGKLPESVVLPWIEQVGDALRYLHSQSPPVIHRDIKPANIRITKEGRAMLVDFGIAKTNDPSVKTTMGARAVTPGYSPPEQYGQGTTDARSDVYALGATLYTALTGHEPPESVQRTIGTPLPAPRSLNPAISPVVEAAMLHALALTPTDRLPSVGAFWRALTASGPVQVTVPQKELVTASDVISPISLTTSQGIGRTIWIGGGLALGVILTFIMGFFIARNQGNFNEIPSPTAAPQRVTEVSLAMSAPTEFAAVNVSPTFTPTESPPSPTLTAVLPTETLTPSPTPTSTWEQGILIFVFQQGKGRSLFSLDLLQQGEPEALYLSNGYEWMLAPSWSPSGNEVAFHTYSDKTLHILTLSSGSVKNLQKCTSPSWASDGQRLVCVSEDTGELLILNSQTGSILQRLFPPGQARLPSWSPAKDEIVVAVVNNSNRTELWSVDLATGNFLLLAGNAYENYAPSWSPDGHQIAYQSAENQGDPSDIWIMDRTGQNKRRLTQSRVGTWSRYPVWSPDVQWIAFVSNRNESAGDNQGEIYVLRVETGEDTRITHTGGSVYEWGLAWGNKP